MAITFYPKQNELARAREAGSIAELASTRPWIVSGLALGAPVSGLDATITDGRAWIAGFVVDVASETITVPDADTTSVYLGLVRDGNDNVTGATLATSAHASGDYVVLGTATASGGDITGVATTGRSPETQKSEYDADEIVYDNATSGLAATEVQAAIDELAGAGGGGLDVQEFTADGTWTKPSGATKVMVMAFGAGGGGGSGRADAGASCGGGKGGSSGSYIEVWLTASDLSDTEAVTIGAGGGGGASVGATNNGLNGNAGGDTIFGSHVLARGGDGGVGGNSTLGVNAAGRYGGCDDTPVYNNSGGGCSNTQPIPVAVRARAGYKQAGGGGASVSIVTAGNSTAGEGGAGFQAWKNIAVPVVSQGGGSAGVNSGSGGNGLSLGDGGGGGSINTSSGGNAGSGGNGANGGGGGGGGGAMRGSGNSGAGGSGGNGYMIVISFL
jgi:hypothetical protein